VLRDGGHGAKWTYLFRFDQDLGSKDRFSARYFSDGYHLDGVLNLKNLLTYADQANIHYYNSLLSETHIFNSHILNNLILSYQIENASRGPLPGAISVADLGVNIWQPAFKQINQIQVNGGSPNGFNVVIIRREPSVAPTIRLVTMCTSSLAATVSRSAFTAKTPRWTSTTSSSAQLSLKLLF
jgi:hypothetical protein